MADRRASSHVRTSIAPAILACAAAACSGHGLRLADPQPVPPLLTTPARAVRWSGAAAPLSVAADLQMVTIAGGRSIGGSTPEERSAAYDSFRETSGSDGARQHGWFEREEVRHIVGLETFRLDLMPVTNAAYAEFVADGGAPPPTMDEETWRAQGFQQKWPEEVTRFVWQDGEPPRGREDHPVVLVTWDEAAAYCEWRGQVVGEARRLPGAHEMEKAARGTEGQIYPWGPTFDASQLDSAVSGPRDTVPVGSYPDAASPFGVLDTAGNVFQWTASPWPPPPLGEPAPVPDPARPPAKMTVKGSAWDDWGGLGRGAAWHGRPRGARHVIVGFRCAADGPPR